MNKEGLTIREGAAFLCLLFRIETLWIQFQTPDERAAEKRRQARTREMDLVVKRDLSVKSPRGDGAKEVTFPYVTECKHYGVLENLCTLLIFSHDSQVPEYRWNDLSWKIRFQ